jgi:hypothetical protein
MKLALFFLPIIFSAATKARKHTAEKILGCDWHTRKVLLRYLVVKRNQFLFNPQISSKIKI